MKDIRIDVRVRNNLVLKKMEEAGFGSVAELSRATGINQMAIGKLANMTISPLTEKGEWRRTVLQLSEFFCCLPEDLFSDAHTQNVLERNRSYAEVNFAEVQGLLAQQRSTLLEPSVLLEAKELREVLTKALDSLEPRDAEALRLLLGFDGPEMTSEEVGEKMGITSARVRQLGERALRYLRHPSRSDDIKEAAFGGDGSGDQDTIEATAFIDRSK